jgi:hypothetical protein
MAVCRWIATRLSAVHWREPDIQEVSAQYRPSCTQISGGAAVTVLSIYDEASHLLGEYDATGTLIEETVWLGDIPVATLRPSGSTVGIYYSCERDLLRGGGVRLQLALPRPDLRWAGGAAPERVQRL